jgi:radical SAM protein with 4Fe4S-binding SPASM domain
MLHPKFDAVIELGSRLGLSQRVVTNASRINKARANLLAAHDVEVGVSLHSANASVHNHLTGTRQGFQKATEGLSLLTEAGARSFVQYSPTRLDPGGLADLARFLRVCYAKAVRFIDINRLLPFGEAAQDKAHVVLDEGGWWDVLKVIGELVSSGWTIKVESVPHCWVRERAASEGLRNEVVDAILFSVRTCHMGINQLAIDPIGRVKLCPGGSPVSDSIQNLKLQEFWRSDRLMQNRRELLFLPMQCLDYDTAHVCQYLYECNGGCRSSERYGDPVDLLLRFRDGRFPRHRQMYNRSARRAPFLE